MKGYPVGTLLFADLGNKTFSVIDGLQRSSTVCEYILNPTKRENLKNVDDVVLKKCRQILFPGSMNITIDRSINDSILSYISSKNSFDEIQSYAIAMELIKQFPTDTDKLDLIESIGKVLESWFIDYKSEFDSIRQTEIPIIVYSGDNVYLNDIFNRINIQGQSLDDYEVYAATWHTTKYSINKSEIVEYVIKKYDSLALDDYTIDSYDSDDLRKSKKLTVFEFLFGFGKYIIKNFEFLNLGSVTSDDVVSPISFELVDACINNNKRIPYLADDLRTKNININLLQRRIEESIKFVQDAIAPICTFRGNKRKKAQYLHPKYFVLALIAFVFREMYDLSNLEEKKESWQGEENTIRNRVLHHYIFEIIQNEWHDGGIGKMYFCVRERTFFEEYTKNDWTNLLDGYYKGALMNRQSKKFSNPTNSDKLILNCIYADIFTVKDNCTQVYDIEHIATKEWMKMLINETALYSGLPVTHIANLCYLPESINRKKKAKTIYEDASLSDKVSFIEAKYSFTKRKDLDFLYEDYSSLNAQQLEEKYIQYLFVRFEKQKEKIFAFLGI